MVDRFTITAAEYDPWVDADPSGQWVRYSDYAALEAQLAEAAKERDEALEELGKVIMACPVGQRSMPISRTVASMRTKLSALEPAAPEGQQPVAWQWRAYEDGGAVTDWHNWDWGDRRGWEAIAKRDPGKYEVRSRPLYTRPSEQAVTEAMERFEKIAEIIRRNLFHQQEKISDARQIAIEGAEALKAAMEAGG